MKNNKIAIATEDDIDEEDYEEIENPKEDIVCRVLVLILLDNNYFSTLVDEQIDMLSSLRLSLNPLHEQTSRSEKNTSSINFMFCYIQNDTICVIPLEHENMIIKDLIDTHNIRNLVINERLILQLYNEPMQISELKPEPDEVFRDHVKILYSFTDRQVDKIIIGKINAKPAITIYNLKFEEESQLKLKDLNLEKKDERIFEISSRHE